MNKRYLKYFGRNITRAVYVVGSALCCIGLFCILFSHRGFGMMACIVGVTLFFLTSHRQVSDKMIDELVQNAEEGYKNEKIKGKVIGKAVTDEEKFTVFSGFIRDDGSVRFKKGRDLKLRTSRYFVTAVHAEKKQCTVFTTVYDMLSGEQTDGTATSLNAEAIGFSKERIEFPQKLYKCILKTRRGENEEELTFYLPADALADKLTERIDEMSSNT